MIVLVLVLVVLCVVAGVPAIVIPTRARKAAMENCVRGNGSFCGARAKQEAAAYLDLCGTFAVTLLVAMSPVFAAALVIHSIVIPLPLIAEAIDTDVLDRQAWQSNPRRGPLESIARRHEAFVIADGGSREQALEIQRTIWTSLPVFGVIWVTVLVFLAAWMANSLRSAFRDYNLGLRTRTLLAGNRRYELLSRTR